MSNSSDTDYKAIFSHPEMVIDIITGFAPGPWLADIDFATLEPFKSSFVSEAEQASERHSDLIWRVRCKGCWLYIYLLFEFQSTINHFMAVRMLVYVGLLYQELIKNKEFDDNNKLPFVLPIVLYNGLPRWGASLSTQDLISNAPLGMAQYIPHLHYHLIDEGSYDADLLSDLENLAAAVFLIETQTSLAGLQKALDKVLKWHDTTKHQALGLAIAKLAARVLRKRMPKLGTTLDSIHDLKGVVSMLEENFDNIVREHEEKAMQKGLQRGLDQGLQQGLNQGLQQGLDQGLKQGLQASMTMLKAMLAGRFGPLPIWAIDKIDTGTSELLEQWCVRCLSTSSLEALFDV